MRTSIFIIAVMLAAAYAQTTLVQRFYTDPTCTTFTGLYFEPGYNEYGGSGSCRPSGEGNYTSYVCAANGDVTQQICSDVACTNCTGTPTDPCVIDSFSGSPPVYVYSNYQCSSLVSNSDVNAIIQAQTTSEAFVLVAAFDTTCTNVGGVTVALTGQCVNGGVVSTQYYCNNNPTMSSCSTNSQNTCTTSCINMVYNTSCVPYPTSGISAQAYCINSVVTPTSTTTSGSVSSTTTTTSTSALTSTSTGTPSTSSSGKSSSTGVTGSTTHSSSESMAASLGLALMMCYLIM